MAGAPDLPEPEPSREPLRLEETGTLLEGADLSDWFNPFLPRFARETLRAGGEAVVAREGDRVVGLLLAEPAERIASVFTRSRAIGEALRRDRPEVDVYAEVDLAGPRETLELRVARSTEAPGHRFRHPVRLLAGPELGRVAGLLREVYGDPAERWLAIAADEGERCFTVEVGGTVVGAAFALVAGPRARLHTLAVKASHRRLGVGTDLLFARLLYAGRAGARVVISEIAESNVASRALADRGGMARAGRMFLYARPQGRPPGASIGPYAAGAPTTG